MARKRKRKKEWFEEYESMENVTFENPYDKAVYDAVCEARSSGMYTYETEPFPFGEDEKETISLETIYEVMKHAGKVEGKYQQEEGKINRSLERLMSKIVILDLSEEIKNITNDNRDRYITTANLLDISIWEVANGQRKISLHNAPSFEERKKQETEHVFEFVKLCESNYGE